MRRCAMRAACIIRSVGLVAAVCLSVSAVAAGTELAVHTLKNAVLTVGVMDPNNPSRYNRGVRFTPLAVVLSVRMDGVEYLYHPDNHDPVSDGGGLASEFDLCIPGGPEADLPSGYLKAGVGEGFLKVGVGILRKEKTLYNLFQQPQVIERAATSVTWAPDSAVFRQVCQGTGSSGYAYSLDAEVDLRDNQVVTTWTLTNTGIKSFTTRQYCHNFFRIDNRDTGSGYVLSFPYGFQAAGLEAAQRQEGRTILFEGPIPQWINAVVPYPEGYVGPNTLTLSNTAARRSIVCETSRPGLRTAIHAVSGYIAPEQFIEITVKPGETQTWTRRYTFERDGDVAGAPPAIPQSGPRIP